MGYRNWDASDMQQARDEWAQANADAINALERSECMDIVVVGTGDRCEADMTSLGAVRCKYCKREQPRELLESVPF